jgi:hypothetical protein
MKMEIKILIIGLFLWAILIFIFISQATADSLGEDHYRNLWCKQNQGRIEVIMPNKTRCDCVTPTYAVEIEFASRWLQSIGQALNYAEQTNLRAGIVLICQKPKDSRKFQALRGLVLSYKLPIDIWSIGCKGV